MHGRRRRAAAASMCAASASDAHVAFRFEERADGKVRVIVVSGTVFMIWPDIFELCNFDGVPVAVGASPVYATASDDEAVVFVGFYPPVAQADAQIRRRVALDPRRPWRRSWRVGRCLEAKAQCRRFAVLVVTADGEHSAAVNACNEYVAAFVGGSVPQPLEALISAAPGLREFLRAERPLCLVDFVHSLRRIWGKSQDYFLLSGDELTYLVWKKDLRHNLVRSPCALACATKSTLVFVVTREGSVLAVTNKQPATVSWSRVGRARRRPPAVPKKASTKRSAPGALALVNPTGVAMFDNDRYLVVADFGQPAADRRRVPAPVGLDPAYHQRLPPLPPPAYSLQLLRHRGRRPADAVEDSERRRRRVRGRGPRAVLVAELKFDLSPAAAIVVKHRVDLGGGEPCQLCVNAGGTMCFVTVWDATSGRVVAVDFEDAFSAKAYGAPFDQSWTIWGITEALVTLPDGGGAAAPAHETAPRVVVGALNGSRLVACDPSGVANVLLAGGDVAGDRDGALPHAQLDQPLGLVTSPHGRASVYVASAAGHCAGSVRLFNFGTTGLRKLMANLRAIGEACVLPDDYGYIRRNLGALPFDSVDAYRAHVHRRPFREAVAAMTAAIESIVADMDVMGAAISRSGGVNATKGPDATPSSATVRAMHAQLLLLDDAFAELVHGGETGLTAAQLDASTSMLDVVTTHAERFNAQQRQAQVNSSAAELGTAAGVVALEPRAIEDALQNGSRTTWDTRKPGDGKTFYVTPEGGKAVPWEGVDAIVKPLRTAKRRPCSGQICARRRGAFAILPERADAPAGQEVRERDARGAGQHARAGPAPEAAAARTRFWSGATAWMTGPPPCASRLQRGAARDGGHADGHGPRDRARAGPGRGRLGSASAYYDHCFMCRRRVATLWRCAHCVKSLCREHAKAADDGPPSASWTCGKAHSAPLAGLRGARREIQDRWSLYQITGRGGVGLYRMRVGPPSTLSSRGDAATAAAATDDGHAHFLGREPAARTTRSLSLSLGTPTASSWTCPRRSSSPRSQSMGLRARATPGPHARVADCAAALHVDDDDDDDEEEEEGEATTATTTTTTTTTTRSARGDGAGGAAARRRPRTRAHLRRSCNTEARVT
ncbi:hypothetical protein JL720_17214 [Aureococcus anophagefferens]|nr:hypothetical protein JL720_17214 [Aureococcus anophagefferens]